MAREESGVQQEICTVITNLTYVKLPTPMYILIWTAICTLPACTSRTEGDRAMGTADVVWYRSPVDGSQQAYGIYVPANPPPPEGYPAVFHAHGYGWSVSSNFSQWQREWADAHRWVLINLNARGPQFYEGIGEVATLEVVRDATSRFGLDGRRLYITGASMGGTGAFRHGLRHPEVFAAAAGVDGWSDFRLWHYEWYARTDARDSIEEFRRPLLQACSPIYWAGRGQWGAIKTIVDGADTTVGPDHGLSLHAALVELGVRKEGYDAALTLNYERGHGGGYSLPDIYRFFEGRESLSQPQQFHCRTYVLKHGEMYWGRIDEFDVLGLPATLASDQSGDTVTVLTENVERFTLHLKAAVEADVAEVRVYADGLECYHGPPDTVTFEALRDCEGRVVAWVPGQERAGLQLHRTPELDGPIGEVFNRPFVVAYGTAGSADMTALHRREAEQFTSGWRSFMIRDGIGADELGPYPEHRLPERLLQERGLVMFGSLESSHLLQRAYRAGDIPIIVGQDYVTVRDDGADSRDRTYHGKQFGCFVSYPNPLAEGRQYLLIARGQWFTRPDGTEPAGLEYDMEKLPWGYPDYVVFNSDQGQLPHVLNVNNKPPVTCYEAAYFVEADYFDRRWRSRRGVTLDRVRAQRPEGDVRLVHAEQMKLTGGGVQVLVADDGGRPCADARVTVSWPAQRYSASGVTDEDGWVSISAPRDVPPAAQVSVLSIMATGAVHDFTADAVHTSTDGPLRLALSATQEAREPHEPPSYRLTATLLNRGDEAVRGLLHPVTDLGTWLPTEVSYDLQPGAKISLPFIWWPRERGAACRPLPTSDYTLTVASRSDEEQSVSSRARPTASVRVRVGLQNCGPVQLSDVTVPNLTVGQPWQVEGKLYNRGDSDVDVQMACSVIPAEPVVSGLRWCYLPERLVTVPAQGESILSWAQQPGQADLPIGLYEAVIYAPDTPELNIRVRFSVTDDAKR